jgi:transcriptional regulator with XRE-family HTH domain
MIDVMAQLADNDIRASFGARLKALRKERKLTQKEAAAQIGVQATHLNKYEAGMHAPPLEKIIALADLYSVSLDFLITGNAKEAQQLKNTRLFERFQALEDFPRDDQETIVKVIDAMIAKNRIEKALQAVPL